MPSRIKPGAAGRSVTEVGPGDYIKVNGHLERIQSNTAQGVLGPRSWTIMTDKGDIYGMYDIDLYLKAEDVE